MLSLFGPAAHAIDPRVSGSWINPERPGEGWVVQVLDADTALVAWFTYPSQAEQELDQLWLLGVGNVVGDQIEVNLQRFSGPTFGAAFNTDDLVAADWGTLTLAFDGCAGGTVDYVAGPDFGSAARSIERLTALDGLDCSNASTTGLEISGSFYDLDHVGEGWFVEELADERVNLYWFTFDGDGRPMWLTGSGERSAEGLVVDEVYRPTGSFFGDGFDPESVGLNLWGQWAMRFDACDQGDITYRSEQFGSDQLSPVRLTAPLGVVCQEPFITSAPIIGQWQDTAPPPTSFPTADNDFGGAIMGGQMFMIGGFNDTAERFLRYDFTLDAWTALSSIPDGGRRGPVTGAMEDRVYLFGGVTGSDSLLSPNRYLTSAFVYRPDLQQWQALPDMPRGMADGEAVVLGDELFLVSGRSPQGFAFHPTASSYREISAPPSLVSGASAIAYNDEIWLIGGEFGVGEIERVVIYNPGADQWRDGPPLKFGRSNAALGVINGQLVAAGGYRVDAGFVAGVVAVEAFSLANNRWSMLASLPTQGIFGAIGGVIEDQMVLTGVARTSEVPLSPKTPRTLVLRSQ